jgi:hypothetical protein
MLPAEEGMSLSVAVSGAHPASYNMDIEDLVKLSTTLHIELVKNVINLQLQKTTRINSVGYKNP